MYDAEQLILQGPSAAEKPLPDVTQDLTRLLGERDPALREELALAVLLTWISVGVYDDLLTGLGDGIAVGLKSTSIFRRSCSAAVLAEVIDRDSVVHRIPATTVLTWGDVVASWLLREQDVRGFEPGAGFVQAIAHGADALGALARSPHAGQMELIVLLDVIADRLLLPSAHWTAGEADRLAFATMHVLARDLVDLDVLEPWVNRLAAGAVPSGDPDHDPFLVARNVQDYLRSLHLQLAVGEFKPAVRVDLLLLLRDRLRESNPFLS